MLGRDVVDYALTRRARLAQVATGMVTTAEVCDAHPHLQLAARHYGVRRAATDRSANCPVCRRPGLVDVHFVYGDALGRIAGQAKAPQELDLLDRQFTEFDVYVVEVCQDCGWNHLVRSFRTGHGGALSPAADG